MKVALTEAERSRLNEVSQRGKASVRTVKRALSLLKADQGLRDREIADVLLVNPATVARARKRYVEEGLELSASLTNRTGRPVAGPERIWCAGRPAGSAAHGLIASTCLHPPPRPKVMNIGHGSQLLADSGGGVGACHPRASPWMGGRTVRQILKKTNTSYLEEERVVYPRLVSGEFVLRGWRTCWTCTPTFFQSTIRSVR